MWLPQKLRLHEFVFGFLKIAAMRYQYIVPGMITHIPFFALERLPICAIWTNTFT